MDIYAPFLSFFSSGALVELICAEKRVIEKLILCEKKEIYLNKLSF